MSKQQDRDARAHLREQVVGEVLVRHKVRDERQHERGDDGADDELLVGALLDEYRATSCGGLSSVGAGRWRLATTVYRGHSPRMLRPLATTVCEACYRAHVIAVKG